MRTVFIEGRKRKPKLREEHKQKQGDANGCTLVPAHRRCLGGRAGSSGDGAGGEAGEVEGSLLGCEGV